MHTRNGRSHRRFEFMLLPGEQPSDFDDPAQLGPCFTWYVGRDAHIVRGKATVESQQSLISRNLGEAVHHALIRHRAVRSLGLLLQAGLYEVKS